MWPQPYGNFNHLTTPSSSHFKQGERDIYSNIVQSAVTPREYVPRVTIGDNSRNLVPLQNRHPDDTKDVQTFWSMWDMCGYLVCNFLFELVCTERPEAQIKLLQIISQTWDEKRIKFRIKFCLRFLLTLCNIRALFYLITISSHFLSAPLTYRTSICNEHPCLSEVQLVCQLKGNIARQANVNSSLPTLWKYVQEMEEYLRSFLTSTLDVGEQSTLEPGGEKSTLQPGGEKSTHNLEVRSRHYNLEVRSRHTTWRWEVDITTWRWVVDSTTWRWVVDTQPGGEQSTL